MSNPYLVAASVTIEFFEDSALILEAQSETLIGLDKTGKEVLSLTDGCHDIEWIAENMAAMYGKRREEMIEKITETYKSLAQSGILEKVPGKLKGKGDTSMTSESIQAEQFLRNPDVVLREEDEEGGLLFNPDNNAVRVVNTTGLFIWKLCDGTHTPKAIKEALQKEFEDAPEDDIESDVQEFLGTMVAAGFVGKVLPS